MISFVSSALLLVIMLENDQPLKVTFLPTMVLLLTTFRLLLSIATTRNIIANEDVGQVIETVGQFVMGESALWVTDFYHYYYCTVSCSNQRWGTSCRSGGSFSLDALPGKQMTIDGDLKVASLRGNKRKITCRFRYRKQTIWLT